MVVISLLSFSSCANKNNSTSADNSKSQSGNFKVVQITMENYQEYFEIKERFVVLKDEFGYFKPILLTYKLESDGSFRFYSSQHSSGEMYRKYEDINNQHSVFKMFK